MKPAKLAFAALVFFYAVWSPAQTLVERLYVMRAESTSVDPMAGMTHTCVVLFPDGRYRYERSFQGISGGQPETKVYMDTLPDSDFKALEAILDDTAFQQIKTAPPRGGIINDMDTLYIVIPREHSVQNIDFSNAAERKPFEKALKPFQNSIKNLEKRKVSAAKGEKSDNCETPRIMYRTLKAPTSQPDSQ